MNIEKEQQAYRTSTPSMLGRGIEMMTTPFSGIISKMIPSKFVEMIVKGIDSATSKPQLVKFTHDPNDLQACQKAAKKIETTAKVMNGATGAASGLGGALTMGADIPATIALSARNIRDTGRAYGFDGKGSEEQLFRLQILEVAALNDPKVRSQRIADLEAAIEPGGNLKPMDPAIAEPLVDQAIERISRALAFAMSRTRVGAVIPLVGSVVGGLVNTSFQGDVSRAARFAFQARRLK